MLHCIQLYMVLAEYISDIFKTIGGGVYSGGEQQIFYEQTGVFKYQEQPVGN